MLIFEWFIAKLISKVDKDNPRSDYLIQNLWIGFRKDSSSKGDKCLMDKCPKLVLALSSLRHQNQNEKYVVLQEKFAKHTKNLNPD